MVRATGSLLLFSLVPFPVSFFCVFLPFLLISSVLVFLLIIRVVLSLFVVFPFALAPSLLLSPSFIIFFSLSPSFLFVLFIKLFRRLVLSSLPFLFLFVSLICRSFFSQNCFLAVGQMAQAVFCVSKLNLGDILSYDSFIILVKIDKPCERMTNLRRRQLRPGRDKGGHRSWPW